MNDLQIIEQPAFQLIKPDDITAFSKILKEFISKSQLSTMIRGEKYVNVDGWKFAGLNFGLVPIVSEPIAVQPGASVVILYKEVEKRFHGGKKKVMEPFFSSTNPMLADRYREKFKDEIVRELTTDYFNYKCGCEIQNTISGKRVGSGYGLCSNLELAKSSYDEYAVMSMSQTRAIGRAFKNVIGFIMKAAGYSPTPSEEMDGQAREISIDEGTMIDIQSALETVDTIEMLTKIWNDLGPQAHASARIINMFKKKKIEINTKKK